MKKSLITLAVLCSMAISSLTYAQDASPHKLSLGLITCHKEYKEHHPSPDSEYLSGMFSGLTGGYDYINADDIYGGVSFRAVKGNNARSGFVTGTGAYADSPTSTLYDIEGRLGYTVRCMFKDSRLVTPYLGCGYYRWAVKGDKDQDPNGKDIISWVYASAGIRIDNLYAINDTTTLGANVALKYMLNGKLNDKENSLKYDLGKRIHFDVEAPITVKIDNDTIEGISYTPFYEYKRTGDSNIVAGGQQMAFADHAVGIKIMVLLSL
jgi:hypothetical protein